MKESLCARAARLAYFSPDELSKSLRIVKRNELPSEEKTRLRGWPKFNLHNVIAPLLRLIHGQASLILLFSNERLKM